MLSNDPYIKDASLTNSINMTGFTMANNAIEINREVLLSNYTQESLSLTWNALCQFVSKNYEQGKGTYIKDFGTFTFNNYAVDLEGTTNSLIRDKKLRTPVFIVSSSFNENIKPGQYTKNGMIYYNLKQNNNINHVKLNYAEISYAISMSKEETVNIIKHLIHHISESIRMNNFKNKIMPHVGELILYKSILGVKFNEDLILKSRSKPQQYQFVKKNMLLNMDVSNAHNTMSYKLTNPYQSIENLRPSISLITKVEPNTDEYLQKKLNINIRTIPKHEVQNIHRQFSCRKSFPISFINDVAPKKKVYVFGMKLKEMKLPNDILEAFEYFKGKIIMNMKEYDRGGNGMIGIEECVDAIMKANVHIGITRSVCEDIVRVYNKGECVEYMKFVTLLLRDCKDIVDKGSGIEAYNHMPKNEVVKRNGIAGCGNVIALSKSGECVMVRKKNEVDNVRNEMKVINALIPQLKLKYRHCLDQNISCSEFNNILSQYNIVYPIQKLVQILTFLEIPNTNAFSINDIVFHFKNTKILNADSFILSKQETSLGDDIITIYTKIKDLIYLQGGINFLFKNNKTNLSKPEFISLLKPLSSYNEETLSSLYDYLVKTDRPFTVNDYNLYFASNDIKFDSHFENRALFVISHEIEKKHLNPDQYFDCLLKYNINTNNKVISRNDFISLMQKEKYKFSALELDYIFTYLDSKKDNVLDKEEFVSKLINEQLPLTKMQSIIKKHNIDIEDLAHRMNIDINEQNQKYSFEIFKDKIKKIENTLSNEFIYSMFNSLKEKESDNFVYSYTLLEAFNVFKKEHMRNIAEGKPSTYIPSFKQYYISIIKNTISYPELKKLFENADYTCCGFLPASEYTRVLKTVIANLNDNDHIKFARISNLCDTNKNLNYSQWLNYIFYNEKNDPFTFIINALLSELQNRYNGNIDLLIKHISKSQNLITIDIMNQYIINELHIDNIQLQTITKLDIDADGIISKNDLQSVLKRYQQTAFFKYENAAHLPNINLHHNDILTSEKAFMIIKKIQKYMKEHNMNEVGLFRMIDKNNDGMISNVDFNEMLDKVISLTKSMKDQLFNYIDYYHNGLVDLETFIFRFKDYESVNSALPLNRNDIENKIRLAFEDFIIRNKTLCDIEIFNIIDKDSDGIININDLKYFIEHFLEIDERELTSMKLDRVLESLSLTKNKHVGLNDIKIYIDEVKGKYKKSDTVNECDVLKATSNLNINPRKDNNEWINSIIERFGLFVSEEYDSIQEFFNKNTETNSGKFTLNDFFMFNDNNYKCFKDGFNLTRDELLAVYTSLDSQKKNYLTLNDLENKLQIFNFYKKMHTDIKQFLNDNFVSGIDAFKLFINPKGTNNNKSHPFYAHSYKSSISHKEFFDAISYFFPHKYNTNTILKYISTYFKSNNNNEIPFSQFNYLYYNNVKPNIHFLNNTHTDMKLLTRSSRFYKSQSTFLSPQPKPTSTPFDSDPLLKLKRIIISSKHNPFTLFDNALALSTDQKHLNKFQFRNILKQLNLGLTHIEIEQIINKCGVSYDGNVNVSNFITFLKNKDSLLYTSNQNAYNIVGEIKMMIYKYYSNPLLCFQTSLKEGASSLDFEMFKSMICDMYRKDNKEQLNYTQMKSAFDVIDLRKDGKVDMNEWMKSFGMVNGSLDINENGVDVQNGCRFDMKRGMCMSQEVKNRKVLREWETSGDVRDVYKLIWKYRKGIRKKVKEVCFVEGEDVLVQSDNLVGVLKEFLPEVKLSSTQWRMLVRIGGCEGGGLVDVDLFFGMVEMFMRSNVMRMKRKFK